MPPASSRRVFSGEASTKHRPGSMLNWRPSSSLLLSSLEFSDTKVCEPEIRALLGTASHFCELAPKHRLFDSTVPRMQGQNSRLAKPGKIEAEFVTCVDTSTFVRLNTCTMPPGRSLNKAGAPPPRTMPFRISQPWSNQSTGVGSRTANL